MQTLISDLRFGLRFFRKNPSFTLIAMVALALGIGANTALFSVVDAVLLRPLPYGDPDRLAVVWEDLTTGGMPRNTPAPANYLDWKKQNQSFVDMACTRGDSSNLTGDGTPELLIGRAVEPNLFSLLQVPAAAGRTLGQEDDRSTERVVVISNGLWQRRYGGDPSLVGKQIQMDGASTTVVGIMPRGFFYPNSRVDYWRPLRMTPEQAAARGSHYLQVIARLKPGVTIEKAQSDLSTIARRLQTEYPNSNRNVGAVVVSALDQVTGSTGTALWILLGAAGFVLLIACANVANLLLAKAVGRQRELAVRQALGAARGRLIRQMITESVLLSVAGGLLGVALAWFSLGAVRALVPPGMAASATVSIDLRILGLALLLSVFTGVLFGAAPALWSGRGDLHDILKQGGRGGIGARGVFRDALVVGEVALALVLLIGAGLMIRTLQSLYSIDVGFRSGSLLTMAARPAGIKYKDPEKRVQFYDRVLEKVRVLPGVQSAAYISDLPFTAFGNTTGFRIQGVQLGPDEPGDALYRVSTTGYLETLGVRLLEGRFYNREDHATAPAVVVINETFKNRFFPNETPLGKKVQVQDEVWRSIVGVVAEVRERGFEGALKPGVYLPIVQNKTAWAVPSQLVIRTRTPPLSLAPAVREIIWSVEPDQPISQIRTMDDIIELQVADRKQQMSMLGAFSVLALILAALGIYGVLAYAVSQRTREIGVRMALGAKAMDVVRMVAGGGLKLVGLGLVIGMAAAFGLTRWMEKILYGVKATDPATYAMVAAVLLAVATLACVIPARRAANVDPMVALRDE